MVHDFEKHLAEANRFIKTLALELGEPDNTHKAVRILHSVFMALRNRVPVQESTHLISQLPLIFKGMYVDGWDMDKPISKSRTWEDFLFEIRNYNGVAAGADFADDEEARHKIATVINALKEYVSEGELEHIRLALPQEIAEAIF